MEEKREMIRGVCHFSRGDGEQGDPMCTESRRHRDVGRMEMVGVDTTPSTSHEEGVCVEIGIDGYVI